MTLSSHETSDRAVTRRQFLAQALRFGALAAGGAMLATVGGSLRRARAAGEPAEPLGNPGFDTNPVVATELAPGLHLVTGPGGNIVVRHGADAALVGDCGIAPRSKDTLAAVHALVGGASARTLVDTHWHLDHAGGNEAFARGGYRLLSSENCRARLSTKQRIEFFGAEFPPAPAVALPGETFAKEVTVHVDDDAIDVIAFAPAHTDGDCALHFRGADVWQTGDIFFNGSFPFIDTSSGGSLDGMIAATERLISLVSDGAKVVPGHGPVGSKKDLQATRDMLATVRDRLTPLIAKGISADDLAAQKPLADLDEKWGKHTLRASHFTRCVYPPIAKAVSGK